MGMLSEMAISEASLSGAWLVLQLAPAEDRITGTRWAAVTGSPPWPNVVGTRWPPITGSRT